MENERNKNVHSPQKCTPAYFGVSIENQLRVRERQTKREKINEKKTENS